MCVSIKVIVPTPKKVKADTKTVNFIFIDYGYNSCKVLKFILSFGWFDLRKKRALEARPT